jgi:hypothetical protein
MASIYDDPEIVTMMRETDALYERMRNERRALLSSEQREEWEKPRDEDRNSLRELKRRLEELEKGEGEDAP